MKYSLLVLLAILAACGNANLGPPKGDKGDPGVAGATGATGSAGQGCVVNQIPTGDPVLPLGGAAVLCGPSSALISNGAQGATGVTGETGGTGAQGLPGVSPILAVLDPCGDAPGIWDELFLKLSTGQIIALVVANINGDYARLSNIAPGTWMTTDGDNCVFTITAEGTFTYESKHY